MINLKYHDAASDLLNSIRSAEEPIVSVGHLDDAPYVNSWVISSVLGIVKSSGSSDDSEALRLGLMTGLVDVVSVQSLRFTPAISAESLLDQALDDALSDKPGKARETHNLAVSSLKLTLQRVITMRDQQD